MFYFFFLSVVLINEIRRRISFCLLSVANCNLCDNFWWLVTTYLLIVLVGGDLVIHQLLWHVVSTDSQSPLSLPQTTIHRSFKSPSIILSDSPCNHNLTTELVPWKLNIFHRKHLSPLLQKTAHKQTLHFPWMK